MGQGAAVKEAEQTTSPSWASGAVVAAFWAVALAASAFRIVLAPGIELTLAPFFYLLAFRVGGLRLGLLTALLTTVPSWFWWGHPVATLVALVQLLFLSRFAAGRSLAWATALFYLFPGMLLLTVFLAAHYGAPGPVIVLMLAKKVLNDLAGAAAVDLVTTLVILRLSPPIIERRRCIGLSDLVSASVTALTMLISLVVLAEHAGPFPDQLAAHRQDVEQALRIRLLEDGPPADTSLVRVETHADADPFPIALGPAAIMAPGALARLGCSRHDDGTEGPNGRDTFAYWITTCVTGAVTTARGAAHYAYSTRDLATTAYGNLVRHMLAPALLLGLGLGLRFLIVRVVNQALARWRRLLEDFGSPHMTVPTGRSFTEFIEPVAAFVDANNRYAQLAEDKARLAGAMLELQRGIGLRLIADIHFDRAAGMLRFTEVGLDRVGQEQVVEVHHNDRIALENAIGREEVLVEFRTKEGGQENWHLLLAQGLAPGGWRSACLTRVRQPSITTDRTLHQARLMELGGMASALSHELKQPLFTIALSAEAGTLILERDGVDTPAQEKFTRILRQVERAREIIGRISSYARVDPRELEPFDVSECVKGVTDLMRPLMIRENIRVELATLGQRRLVRLPRVALEQVVVNLLQNAADAIAARGRGGGVEPGRIWIGLAMTEEGLRLDIEDNGIGLGDGNPDELFAAFATTKGPEQGSGLGLYISRQIMLEMGGRLTLAPCAGRQGGAKATLILPSSVLCDTADAALQVAAQA